MLDYARARRTMVDSQLRTFDITDRALLAAMGEVARENFVPRGREELAYGDQATMLPGEGGDARAPRWMLPPMVLGRMLQALRIEAGMNVLDVGCGYGYGAAVMERLGAKVTALESMPPVAAVARERLEGWAGVSLREGSLPEGWAEAAPFARILVNGSVDRAPDRLLQQLGPGGRLVCVTGGRRPGKAVIYVRSGDTFGATTLFDAQVAELTEFAPEQSFVF